MLLRRTTTPSAKVSGPPKPISRRHRHSWRARWRIFRQGGKRFFQNHLVLSLGLLLVFGYIVFEIGSQWIGMCRDAYVTADIVTISPQVGGIIKELAVVDNQAITAGDLLFSIDQTPYQIAVEAAKAALELSRANLKKVQTQVELAAADITAKQAVYDDASKNRDRIVKLFTDGATTAMDRDAAVKAFAVAESDLQQSRDALKVAVDQVGVQTAIVHQAEATLAKANYDLSCTRVTAPVSGRIAPLIIRAGQTVQAASVTVAIVSNHNWRIVANIPNRYLPRLPVGQRVLFTVGSEPWHFYWGKVRSTPPGVARSSDPSRALPYVATETDWIRLPRRFPVEVDLGDLSADQRLFAGEDATVLVIPFTGSGG
ncbi:MAG: HlyD family secretion protein [Verrucomicrobia bacterium]|nr:HlyD family secretion protein [Verrucomicrobiota bacterium]